MEKNKLYETIFKRKSIRNYDLTPLDQNTLTEIKNHLNALESLYKDIKTEFKIIGTDDVKRRIMKKSPHYIAVFSENKEGYLTNAGFMLQQMDLYLSAKGIGTCWQGIPQPKKEVLESSDLEFVILIAFGKANEPLHRKGIAEFKRKSLKEISNVHGADELMEAVRLAPSASNNQPWFFTGDENIIHVYAIKPGFIRGLLAKRYIPIDVGIAFYHLKLAAENYGRKTEIMFDKTAPDYSSKGYEYITSLRLK
ncbi:MAG: nitroreductase family protein [Methanobacterium sp.]|nr:nitroreductase family protein [Methanobacterium sp.]